MTRLADQNEAKSMTADELNAALAQEWCNGCKQPRAKWGPVCPGMTQGDWTHYHSPEWWQRRFLLADQNERSRREA